MITGDDRWYQVAALLLGAVQGGLTTTVNRAGIVPGAIAWDGADCGALYLTWTQLYPSDSFPHATVEPFGDCGPAIEVMEYTLQVVRCTPTGDTSRSPVGVRQLSDTARQLMVDAQQMVDLTTGLLCGLKDPSVGDIYDYMLGVTMPVGPEGGLVATELNIAVGLS